MNDDEREVLNFLNGKNNNNVNYGAIDEEAGQVSEVHLGRRSWLLIKYKLREPLAEFLGTFIMVTFGIGSIAQMVLSKGENGNWVTVSFGFGLGLALALALSRDISGGHLNPAVTITFAVYRNFPWRRVPGYIFAQTTGAFVAAAAVYLNYRSALTNFDGGQRTVSGVNSTAGIFATYPAPFKDIPSSFFSEAFGTFLLLLVILSVTDNHRNKPNPISKITAPFTIGFALFAIAISFGYETGFALNGARDFGPRLFTLWIGYGAEVFSASHFYFWVPLVAPVIGGLSAGFVYDSLIYWGRSPLTRDRSIRIR